MAARRGDNLGVTSSGNTQSLAGRVCWNDKCGGDTTMTENERRAQDTLDKNDLIRRAVLCGGMIASFFTALLVFTP